MRLLQLIEILLNEILLNADWCMTQKNNKKMNRGGCDLHMAVRAKIGAYTELMEALEYGFWRCARKGVRRLK